MWNSVQELTAWIFIPYTENLLARRAYFFSIVRLDRTDKSKMMEIILLYRELLYIVATSFSTERGRIAHDIDGRTY